jgi:hypothetical protein
MHSCLVDNFKKSNLDEFVYKTLHVLVLNLSMHAHVISISLYKIAHIYFLLRVFIRN